MAKAIGATNRNAKADPSLAYPTNASVDLYAQDDTLTVEAYASAMLAAFFIADIEPT
jgi:hypothetical protein